MGKVDYGIDYKYAQTRLNYSVVRHNNDPFLVMNILKDGLTSGINILKGEEQAHHLGEFDLSPVPLGYVNTTRDAEYAGRIPSRTYRQGLTDSNFWSYFGTVGYDNRIVAQTIVGDYPTIYSCVENVLCREQETRAFSRNFALGFIAPTTEDMKLLYKHEDVGVCAWNSPAKALNYKFHDGMDFLDGLMEEALYVD